MQTEEEMKEMEKIEQGLQQGLQKKKTPIFNLPKIILALIILIWAVFLVENFLLNAAQREEFILLFAFIPVRYIAPNEIIGGLGALFYTPFSHALLHGGWEHLIFNTIWLAIFGTPVALRYGAVKFLIIFFISALAGAALYAALTLPSISLLVGASGGISGLTGVAIRFIFQPLQMMQNPKTGENIILGRSLAGFADIMKNKTALAFIIIWVGLNALVPLGAYLFKFGDMNIAWQAHLGGFFAGFLIAPLFERRKG